MQSFSEAFTLYTPFREKSVMKDLFHTVTSHLAYLHSASIFPRVIWLNIFKPNDHEIQSSSFLLKQCFCCDKAA